MLMAFVGGAYIYETLFTNVATFMAIPLYVGPVFRLGFTIVSCQPPSTFPVEHPSDSRGSGKTQAPTL